MASGSLLHCGGKCVYVPQRIFFKRLILSSEPSDTALDAGVAVLRGAGIGGSFVRGYERDRVGPALSSDLDFSYSHGALLVYDCLCVPILDAAFGGDGCGEDDKEAAAGDSGASASGFLRYQERAAPSAGDGRSGV